MTNHLKDPPHDEDHKHDGYLSTNAGDTDSEAGTSLPHASPAKLAYPRIKPTSAKEHTHGEDVGEDVGEAKEKENKSKVLPH